MKNILLILSVTTLTFCSAQTRKSDTIFVSSKNHPRLLAYQDSLYSYLNGNDFRPIKEQIISDIENMAQFNFDDKKYWAWLCEDDKREDEESLLPIQERISKNIVNYRLLYRGKESKNPICMYTVYNPVTQHGYVWCGIFIKPKQPVVYRPKIYKPIKVRENKYISYIQHTYYKNKYGDIIKQVDYPNKIEIK